MRLGTLALALVVLAAACGGESEPQSAGTTTASPVTTSGAEESAAGVDLAGETLDGEPLSLADLRGKPVFVNVWASW